MIEALMAIIFENMKADYRDGDELLPSLVANLVAFVEALRRSGRAPSRDWSTSASFWTRRETPPP